jgi:alpha-tubulin suppressor-like RCC1 family protein
VKLEAYFFLLSQNNFIIMKRILLIVVFSLGLNLMEAQCLTTVDSGYLHNFGLKSNGTILGWGYGNVGQLGDGAETDLLVPTQIGSSSDWQHISCGAYLTFVIKTNGALWCAGNNNAGQLGTGTTIQYYPLLTQVGTATNWQQVASGDSFTVGLKTNGTLWAWGRNDTYQMGDGSCCTDRLSPGQVGTANDWAFVAASGTRTALAIKTNGTLWGWGLNGGGILGPSTVSSRQNPTQLNTATNWSSLSVGWTHVLALKTNNTLWSWGGGHYGENGDTFPQTYFRDTPVQIGTDTWFCVSAGFEISYGVKTNGTLWAWGHNNVGQLGDGTTTDRYQPVQIGTDTDWVTVSAGYQHGVALKSNGALWAWGNNDYGQLGNGTTTATTTPIGIPVAGCTLDTPTFESEPLTLSPSPAKDELSIRYTGTTVVNSLVIYDITGRVVYTSHPLASASLQATLPVHELSSGTYLLVLQSNGKTVVSKRFVKE